MEITINGEQENLTKKISLKKFISAKNLNSDQLIIRYNQQIIKRPEWSNITLQEGDTLEILNFVGGG